MSAPLLGVDLGGTKIEVAALSRDDGRFLLRERVATPKDGYDALLQSIAELVRGAESSLCESGLPLGVGIPGCLSPATGLVKGANSTMLNGRALDRDLRQLLQRPVRCENDANCLAVSETVDGASAGEPVVLAVILGTGVGAALDAQAIVAAAAEGEPRARASFERYCERLARALAQIINLLDPSAIVLGGGLSNVDALYDDVPRRWARHVFSDTVTTPLLRARHGDSSGVRGAAWLWR